MAWQLLRAKNTRQHKMANLPFYTLVFAPVKQTKPFQVIGYRCCICVEHKKPSLTWNGLGTNTSWLGVIWFYRGHKTHSPRWKWCMWITKHTPTSTPLWTVSLRCIVQSLRSSHTDEDVFTLEIILSMVKVPFSIWMWQNSGIWSHGNETRLNKRDILC